MQNSQLDRRQFNKYTAAAFGGLIAGSAAGCGGKGNGGASGETDASQLLAEPHVCRGLNMCQGKGQGGKNVCAGQGGCASANEHLCKGANSCKGEGGCGDTAGQNTCKGQGACQVPLKNETWQKARAKFEAEMKKAGKEVGTAPAAAS